MVLQSPKKYGAEHVYTVLVKQQVVKSIVELFACFILPLILSITLTYLFTVKWKFFSKEILQENNSSSGILDGTVLLISYCIVVFLLSWTTIVTGFINPEYGAMSDIMNWVNQVKKIN